MGGKVQVGRGRWQACKIPIYASLIKQMSLEKLHSFGPLKSSIFSDAPYFGLRLGTDEVPYHAPRADHGPSSEVLASWCGSLKLRSTEVSDACLFVP